MKKHFIFALPLLMLCFSCSEKNLSIENEKELPITKTDNFKEGLIKLGKKLENPYTLQNMQKALDALGTKSGQNYGILQPTHLYVRFLPKTENEYDFLKRDQKLELFPFPLDYELSEGETYHDPTIPMDQITWQYTKVPIGYIFSAIKHEVLDQVYIPVDEIENEKSISVTLPIGKQIDFQKLVGLSMELTGNIDPPLTKGLFGSSWNPSATIRAWDDLVNDYVPIARVKVKARSFLTWCIGYTNTLGYASLPSLTNSANYTVVWENDAFDIRDGLINQAYYNGPKIKGHWTLNINSGKSVRYSAIFRATMRAMFGNNLGAPRPGLGIKIAHMEAVGTGSSWDSGMYPDIKVYSQFSPGVYKPTHEIFRTTMHELGHDGHHRFMGNISYWQIAGYIAESWADAVEWAVTMQEYNEFGIDTATNDTYKFLVRDMDKQRSWTTSDGSKSYTPIFIDLIDNINQKDQFPMTENLPQDVVSGYTMSNLGSFLNTIYGLSSLTTKLKANKPMGVTDAQIDTLISEYSVRLL